MARPKKDVNVKLLEDLAMIGCTTSEIATILEVSEDTLERRFAALLRKGKDEGKSSLRRMQWKAASSGNVTMQIWLGKQLLGQKERRELDINFEKLSNEDLEKFIIEGSKKIQGEKTYEA